MRPMVNGEGVGGGNLTGKPWLESSAKELWEAWGIHFLILLSFSLQVFLFLAAGMRRWCTSLFLSKLLWLAYVSADSVAIFVLGHLAAHASGPSHHLMFFWTPFVLVHLGGQDTITAFSKQDNELWKRHLVNLVYQAGVAGYVVAEVSWPDGRLRAAMVLMFLSRLFRYAERTWCLFNASSAALKSHSLRTLAQKNRGRQESDSGIYMPDDEAITIVMKIFYMLMSGSRSWQSVPAVVRESVTSIMSVDAPLNEQWTIVAKDHLPYMLEKFGSSQDRYNTYQCLVAHLAHCYQTFYTKTPLRSRFYKVLGRLVRGSLFQKKIDHGSYFSTDYLVDRSVDILILLCTPLQYASTPIALVLFWAAEKGDHSSRADIIVSYILLLGALVLDVSSVTASIVTRVRVCIGKYFQHACCRRWRWSGRLAQYNIIRRYNVQDTAGMASSIRQCIGKSLSALGVDPFDVIHVPLTLSMEEFIFDNLASCGTRKEWNIASTRGQLALQKFLPWKGPRGDLEAVDRTTSSSVAFPTSVLIWHIATYMCYYCKEASTSSSSDDETNKHKEMSRELSNYVMYLIFKCGVMLTTNAQLEHNRTRDQIEQIFGWDNPGAEEAVTKLFRQTSGHQTTALTLARDVALELISITDKRKRWHFIASVWSEMLYYTAPRCVGAFHYEHLATGGEFVTQVLLLMYFLGPFMPGSGA